MFSWGSLKKTKNSSGWHWGVPNLGVAHLSTCVLALGFFSFSSTPILLFFACSSLSSKNLLHFLVQMWNPLAANCSSSLYPQNSYLQTVWASSLPSQACNSLLYYITGRFCVFTYRNTEISVKPVAINILFPELGCFAYNCKGKYRSIGFFIFLHPLMRSQYDLKLSVYEVYTWSNLFYPKLLPLKSLCL